ncbi:MAG: ABC transporter permease [Anaerolineales bacterium]|nr:ABC transporter permease [Anaerolineales bacterium]
MKILNIVLKDILQILKDRKTLFFLVLLPLVFTLFFGLVFNPSTISNTEEISRLRIAVLTTEGEKTASEQILNLLQVSETLSAEEFNLSDLDIKKQELADGDFDGLLLIPKGYGESIRTELPVELEIIVDPESPDLQSIEAALRLLTGRISTAALAARLSTQTLARLQPEQTTAELKEAFWQSMDLAVQAWESPAVTMQVSSTGQAGNADFSPSGFTQSSPGMIVQFAIFGLINAAMVLVLERNNRALDRLLSTPTTRVQILLGHILGMFVVILVQELILVLLGQVLFKVDYLSSPLGTLLMIVSLALWSSALGLMISVFSSGTDQVLVFSLLAMFIFSAMGGAWFPLEITGQTFNRIGHLLPTAWAMDGFQNIIIRGQGVSSVLLPAAILLMYTAVFFILAVMRFSRSTR